MNRILKIVGQVMLYGIILIFFTIYIPQIFKYEAFTIVSGSMEPELSVGEIIYTKSEAFEDISVGDIIAFREGDSVVAHRVVEIDSDQYLFTTKGDANESKDMNKTAYTNLYGVVVFHFPLWGYVTGFFSNLTGKLIAVAIVLVGAFLWMLADKLKNAQPRPDGPFSEGVTIKRQPKRRKRSYGFVLITGIVIVLLALGSIAFILYDYKSTENLYSSVRENNVHVADNPNVDWSELISVDFEALRAINPDVIGWLYVENTDISYPIMYGASDDTYLHTDLEGNYAKAGSIFMEAVNSTDFSDSHTIIYGHNMRNLSMFGTLKYYTTEENYIDEHRYFQILTYDGHKYRYEIFSLFNTEADSFVYAVPYGPTDDFTDYISKLCRESYIKPERTVSSTDYVITLSTCSSNDTRLVVNGVRVDSK